MHQTLHFHYGGYGGVDAHYSPAGGILVPDSDSNNPIGDLQYPPTEPIEIALDVCTPVLLIAWYLNADTGCTNTICTMVYPRAKEDENPFMACIIANLVLQDFLDSLEARGLPHGSQIQRFLDATSHWVPAGWDDEIPIFGHNWASLMTLSLSWSATSSIERIGQKRDLLKETAALPLLTNDIVMAAAAVEEQPMVIIENPPIVNEATTMDVPHTCIISSNEPKEEIARMWRPSSHRGSSKRKIEAVGEDSVSRPKKTPKHYSKPADRERSLKADSWITAVEAHRVKCKGCISWISLDKNVKFKTENWAISPVNQLIKYGIALFPLHRFRPAFVFRLFTYNKMPEKESEVKRGRTHRCRVEMI
ncbi:hypothetical protein B0H10DRAFT_1957009 [Mycena sp. CBHHK59/15]|nr:hypothetical protein B0H10DRAFT_1957009 [Mycena sp. CBHHK59/15]